MIHTDAQHLGVRSRKLSQVSLVSRDLTRSNRRPGQREEDQDDVPSAQLTEGNLIAQVAGQRKIWSGLTYLWCHWFSFFSDCHDDELLIVVFTQLREIMGVL